MRHLLPIILIILTVGLADAVTPKEALRAALVEIDKTEASLAKAQNSVISGQRKITKLQGEIDELAAHRDALTLQVANLDLKLKEARAKQLQTGRERDILLLSLAISLAAATYGLVRPIVMGLVPPPYNIVAGPVAALVIFVAVFALGRVVVHQIVALLT